MATNVKLTVKETEVLLTCCAIEKECAKIYWFFSKLFADQEPARKLWQKTALEEDGHAEQCMLAYHLRGSGMLSVDLQHEKAKDLLAKVESIYDAVQKTPPSLEEALKIAIAMEEHLTCCHMDIMVAYSDPQMKTLFASMRKAETEHVEVLRNAYDALVRGA